MHYIHTEHVCQNGSFVSSVFKRLEVWLAHVHIHQLQTWLKYVRNVISTIASAKMSLSLIHI